MSKLISLLLLLVLLPSAFAQSAITPVRHTKSGRQYVLELARRFADTKEFAARRELMRTFRDLSQNLPKDNSLVSLSTTMDSFAKIAMQACANEAAFEPSPWNDVSGLYQTLIDRPATADEIKNAVRNDQGQLDYLSNCVVLALSPEFLYEK